MDNTNKSLTDEINKQILSLTHNKIYPDIDFKLKVFMDTYKNNYYSDIEKYLNKNTQIKKIMNDIQYTLYGLLNEQKALSIKEINDYTTISISKLEDVIENSIDKLLTPSVINPLIKKPIEEFSKKCDNYFNAMYRYNEATREVLTNLIDKKCETLDKTISKMNNIEKKQNIIIASCLTIGGIVGSLATFFIISSIKKD